MSEDNDFRVRPGKAKRSKAQGRNARSLVAEVLRVAALHGGTKRAGWGGPRRRGQSSFGKGRTAFARSRLFSSSRRVLVKALPVRHRIGGCRAVPLTAHVSYLKREGVTRDGAPTQMFDAESDRADDRAFAERCKDDRHHFRIIVSPEDAAELTDLREYTRDLVRQMEADLGTRLEWVGVDHWNTDNPHVHVLVRGITDQGADLIMARDYIRLYQPRPAIACRGTGVRGVGAKARARSSSCPRPRRDRGTLDAARYRDRPRCGRVGRHRPAARAARF